MTRTKSNDMTDKKATGLLALFAGDLAHSDTIPLSALQVDIILKSLYKEGTDADSGQYSDDELLTCTDAERAYKRPLFSIRRAGAMMAEQNITGVALFLYPEQPDEYCLPLTVTQAAVSIGRLGIDLANKRHPDDTVLAGIYRTDWEPRFKKQVAPTPPAAPRRKPDLLSGLLTPALIKAGLDATIIGQEAAKQKVATAVYRQALALRYNAAHIDEPGFVPLRRTNLLLCGPSGSGKTAMIKKLGAILDRPVLIYDATTLTPAGYIGNSPDDILRQLLDLAGGDPDRASAGIVFLDEWDKAFAGAGTSRDMAGFKGAVCSYELLRMMDGCLVELPGENGPVTLDTGSMLFIMGGAFPHLDEIILQRIVEPADDAPIGFMAEEQSQQIPDRPDELPDPTPADLKRYGIPAETLGRIGAICRLKELSRSDLVDIMVRSDLSPLEEQRRIFGLHHITLDVPEYTLQTIADLAVEKKLGARGLGSILDSVLSPALYKYAGNDQARVLRLEPACFTAGAEPTIMTRMSSRISR